MFDVVKVVEVRQLKTKKDGRPFLSVVFESKYSKYPLNLAMFDNFEGVAVGSELALVLDHDRYFNASLRLEKLER